MFFTTPGYGSAIKSIRIYRDLGRVIDAKYKRYKQITDHNPKAYVGFDIYLKQQKNVWFGSEDHEPRKLGIDELLAAASAKGLL